MTNQNLFVFINKKVLKRTVQKNNYTPYSLFVKRGKTWYNRAKRQGRE